MTNILIFTVADKRGKRFPVISRVYIVPKCESNETIASLTNLASIKESEGTMCRGEGGTGTNFGRLGIGIETRIIRGKLKS